MSPLTVRRKIARNIRRLADHQELSLNDLAIEAGVTRSSLFKALQAESSMTIDTLTKIATALRVHPADLLR